MTDKNKMAEWADALDSVDSEFDSTRLDKDVEILKARFKGRGFSLTTPEGNIVDGIPTWCTGTIADRVFYFRLRRDNATLRVGRFDVEVAEVARQKDIARVEKKIREREQEAIADGSSLNDADNLGLGLLRSTLTRLREESSLIDSAHPNVIEFTVHRKDVTGEPFSSFLNPGMAATLIGDMLEEAIAELNR